MYGEAGIKDLSRGQFDAARLGFFQLLRRKRMSPQFVDRHGEDLFAQACFEYSRRVSEGIEIGDPAAWIVTCGWNRTKNLLESRDYRPKMVSIESMGEPATAESGPEETFLEGDRGRKVREAVEELPLYQRQLLALSYFEGQSIREAARRLRWTASKAQRAHEAAQKRLLAMLEGEFTDELRIEIGLIAFLSVCARRMSGHLLPAGAEAVVDHAHRGVATLADRAEASLHRLLGIAAHPSRLLGRRGIEQASGAGGRGPLERAEDLGRRLMSGGAGEAGAALAGEGGGRALEVCKGLAVCVIGGGALTGALIAGGNHSSHTVAHRSPPARTAQARPRPRRRHQATPPPTVSTAPRQGGSPATPSHETSEPPERRHAPPAKAPRVEEATPTTTSTKADHEEAQEVAVEEQFQNFAATEGSAGESTSPSRSVTDAATSAEPAPSSSPSSAKQTSEEAQAAKQFHSLLE